MHEMGIAMQIVEIAAASIPGHLKGVPVEKINLRVGMLSAVVADNLRLCFQAASHETPVAGAQLVIREIPVVARCNSCGHQWTVQDAVFQCEACRSGSLELLSGRELDIESIELSEEDPP